MTTVDQVERLRSAPSLLFEPASVRSIAEAIDESVGLNRMLADDRYHLSIATLLNDAFSLLIFYEDKRPSLKGRGIEYSNIAAAASKLLNVLGYDPNNLSDNFSVGRLSDTHAELLMDYGCASGDLKHQHAVARAITASNESTHALFVVAQQLASLSKQTENEPTRAPSIGLDLLFRGLASAYFASFGIAPDTSSDRTHPTAPAHLWAAEVVRHASGKLPNVPACLMKIRTPAALANRMRDGWLAWKRLSDAERWPAHAMVPDWIKKPR